MGFDRATPGSHSTAPLEAPDAWGQLLIKARSAMAYVQATQQLLQSESNPLVVKPKLQEALLQKPPFRFLHDVISQVMLNTGFAQGLYSGAELDPKSMEKEAKVQYLQKMIDVVSLALREPVPARPSKIVAGLEPEATNQFLQMLGRAAMQGNGAQAVQIVLSRQQPQQQAGGASPPPVGKGALPAVKPPTHAHGSSPGARPALQAHGPSGTPQQPSLGSHPFDEDALEAEEAAAGESGAGAAAVVFQRAQALLPQLEVRMREVQAALGAAGPQGRGTLQLCGTIKAMCEDASVLSKCIEGLQSNLDLLVKEGSHWAGQAAKLGQRVLEEERGLAEARAAWDSKLRGLDGQIAAVVGGSGAGRG